MLRWRLVHSSAIFAIGYEKATLYVTFNSGNVYEYFNVPQNAYNAFLNASSYGQYFNKNIKDHYNFKKL